MTQNAEHRGHKIRARREELGLNADEVALDIGIRSTSLSRIERTGKVHGDVFRKIAARLGCTRDDLEVVPLEKVRKVARRR